jgi:hypothetical protein
MKTKLAMIFLVTIALATATGTVAAKKGASSGSKADYRSAKSGKYVKKGYSEKNKATTVREERKKN